jgi:hypothetical protein
MQSEVNESTCGISAETSSIAGNAYIEGSATLLLGYSSKRLPFGASNFATMTATSFS